VRQLQGLLPAGTTAPAEAPRQDLAERLGQWLNVADAITLSSAQASIAAIAFKPTPVAPVNGAALRAELDRVRAVLSRSITTRDPRHKPDPNDPDTELALCLQRYQDQQRRMEMSVDALRTHVRQTLAKATPRLAQLAALDAVMDQMLGGREQRLLNGVPAFLKTRFKALRREAAEAAEAGGTAWLDGFVCELEQTLLAELDHRLLPVLGLVEALEP
jgi:hypothetical protein